MPKSRKEKEATIKELSNGLGMAKSVVFADFKGLKVKEVTGLRKELRGSKVDTVVAKKTLMSLAFKQAGLRFDPQTLPGNIIAVNLSFEDEVAPAKILAAFGKKNEAMKILGGILENSFLEEMAIRSLAALPSKQELLAKMAGSIQAPISGFVNVLAGNLRGLAQVLNAYKEARA